MVCSRRSSRRAHAGAGNVVRMQGGNPLFCSAPLGKIEKRTEKNSRYARKKNN